MITFQNKGLIDLTAVTTFGVSVKESQSAIGYFGTGLKYAIAIILRLGGKITIQRGDGIDESYVFTAETQSVRGKDFSIVCMNRTALGFTTHMGVNWEPWQAFRELYCNALDEGGEVYFAGVPSEAGHTSIYVECEEIEACFHKRYSIVIPKASERLARLGSVEVLPGLSNHLYYRGILAAECERSCRFTYNITDQMVLTEDRTLKSPIMAIHAIRKSILAHTDKEFIKTWLQSERDSFENRIDLAGWGDDVSSACLEAIEECVDDVSMPLNMTALALLRERRPVKENFKEAVLDASDRNMIDRAHQLLRFMGFDIDKHPITFVDNLGNNILGTVRDNNILIAKRALQIGDKTVAGTMLEEFLHREFRFQDCTRDFQNYLIDLVMTMGQKLKEADNGRYARLGDGRYAQDIGHHANRSCDF